MHKRLEWEAVHADLAAVEALLASRDQETDPLGWMQFNHRKAELEKELQSISSRPSSKSVVMLFGGQPVVGSRGISADFSANMISVLQSLVSTHAASVDGALAERGPIPQRNKSQMLVTDVARGSFGFVLEGADQQEGDAPLSIESVCSLVADIASTDVHRFVNATEGLDQRLLTTLKQFFRALGDNSATIRLITDESEFLLDKEAIDLAQERTNTLRVSEPSLMTQRGRIFTIPDSRRFELFPGAGDPVIKGNINIAFVRRMFEDEFVFSQGFNSKIVDATLQVKETSLPSGETRKSFSLMDVSLPDE